MATEDEDMFCLLVPPYHPASGNFPISVLFESTAPFTPETASLDRSRQYLVLFDRQCRVMLLEDIELNFGGLSPHGRGCYLPSSTSTVQPALIPYLPEEH